MILSLAARTLFRSAATANNKSSAVVVGRTMALRAVVTAAHHSVSTAPFAAAATPVIQGRHAVVRRCAVVVVGRAKSPPVVGEKRSSFVVSEI